MPPFSDFISLSALSQGALVLISSLMAWRGLHLAGDISRIKRVAWGSLCILCCGASVYIGASANQDANSARKSLGTVSGQLTLLQGRFGTIQQAMEKVAQAAGLSIMLPPDIIASEVANRVAIGTQTGGQASGVQENKGITVNGPVLGGIDQGNSAPSEAGCDFADNEFHIETVSGPNGKGVVFGPNVKFCNNSVDIKTSGGKVGAEFDGHPPTAK